MGKRAKVEKTVKVKTKSTKRLRKQKLGSGLYLAPSLIGVLLFFIIPFMVVIFYSVVDNPISMNFVFLDNFK
ncbi:MAG: sugar ABC transporter permease, partial [Lachnospiraceae bacterium]|nr:sugar ABC transporter permease [Lachnospiraceae bacterium]